MKRDPIFAAEQALRGDLFGWLHDHTEQEGDCMIWQGGYNCQQIALVNLPRPYPRQPNVKGVSTPVRRVVWAEYHHKRIPDGYQVWNRSACGAGCVNPEHLICGTYKTKYSQLKQSGKLKRDIATAAKYAQIRRASSSITWEIVDAIRAVYHATPSNQGGRKGVTTGKLKVIEQLAEQYGLTVSTVSCICYGKRWVGQGSATERGAIGAMAYQLGLTR